MTVFILYSRLVGFGLNDLQIRVYSTLEKAQIALGPVSWFPGKDGKHWMNPFLNAMIEELEVQ